MLAAAIYAPLPFLLARQKVFAFSGLAGDTLLAVATCLLLWILLSAKDEAKRSLGHTISRQLARFSYTLYVVHVPFLVLIAALVVGDARWYPNRPHIVLGFAILGVALAYAYGVAALTEFRTDSLRRRIEQWLAVGGAEESVVATRE